MWLSSLAALGCLASTARIQLSERSRLSLPDEFVARRGIPLLPAEREALVYPDLFVGGLFVGAADYFRWVRSSNPRWSAWEPTFPPPPADLLQLARSRGRYVLLTGSRDSNRALVRDVHRAYLADGIRRAMLIEVPDLEHELPPARCFEDALALLLSAMPGEPRQPTGLCR